MYAGREEVNPQAGAIVRQMSINRRELPIPRKDLDCAEVYVPFSWYEPMWLENLGFAEGEGWKLTMDGATSLDEGGDIPWNCSGGVLSSNPIGASGMIRFAEAARQVRGDAGDHQVEGAKTGPGPRLWRRCPILRHVGRWRRKTLIVSTPSLGKPQPQSAYLED